MSDTKEVKYEETTNKIVKTVTYVEENDKTNLNGMIETKENNIDRLNEQLAVEQQELDDLLAIKNK